MRYLEQAMVPDSYAHKIVKSFPATGENYEKAITALKNRFRQDDIIVEFYVCELLGLVLQNVAEGNKRLFTSLYDKLECIGNIRRDDGQICDHFVSSRRIVSPRRGPASVVSQSTTGNDGNRRTI